MNIQRFMILANPVVGNDDLSWIRSARQVGRCRAERICSERSSSLLPAPLQQLLLLLLAGKTSSTQSLRIAYRSMLMMLAAN